ncbi:hypothetical protein BuS5_01083 [Desulfosarcina sp. BuS5]|uniref:hypothetical protein n=1 Tax=Desulfosarcina sp. BuS5 TaxID=933262 RepID=UPI000684B39F|nr:hypothetical protein [Desulfosarcina sp. BuS5]WDN88115.1 hypothetical protein BuS5_01083 [Desulfosarcina sp. BuS5]
MLKTARRVIAFFVIGALIIVLTSSTSIAENQHSTSLDDGNAAAMIADFIFVRPLGNVAIATGAAFFTISMPFSALGGNFKQSVRKLVVEPFKFTWIRPLGKGI